jgi:hypothetical protein
MDEIIAIEKDKLGDTVTVCFCKGEEIPVDVNVFFLRQLANLIESGHSPSNFIPTLVDKRIIYLKILNEVVAHIIWEWHGRSTYIVFTAISKKYEKRGLYSMLHRYYEDRITKIKPSAEFSKSQLHVTNERIIELSKQNGYEIEYYKMIKKF